ncbi:MAG: hypothetical protein IKP95_01710 [Ruminococcus sp.]|nr:hypothetical protein [Ruminococcus sp.]
MENRFGISNRVTARVSLAVLLLDDLTGLPITGSNARAWIEGQKPPVKKSDGWNAFLELPPGSYTVTAEGGTFSRITAEVSIGSKLQTLLLRLSPNRLYRVPPDCIRVEGRAEPGAEITLFPRGRQAAFKLLKDAGAGDREIALYCSGSTSPEGRLLRLTAPDGSGETVRTGSPSGDGSGDISLEEPLLNSYPKIGTVLAPAVRTRADGKGSFFAVVRVSSADTGVVVQARGSSEIIKEFPRGEGSTLTAAME